MKRRKYVAFSKQIIEDTRPLLWIVTISAIALAFLCVWRGYLGSLPWISSMVALPWAAHSAICSFYLNMAKSDHKEGGITFAAAKQNNFSAQNQNDMI